MTSEQQPAEDPTARGIAGTTDDGRVYVVTPTSMAVEGPPTRRRAGRGRRAEVGHRHGRAAGQGDADRQHDPPAAGRGEVGTAGRRQPATAAQHPRGLDRGAEGGSRPGAGRASWSGSRCPSVRTRPRATPSCGSPRRSSSAGWRGCSTASRRLCSPSRWRPAPSWSRCVGRCPRASPPTTPSPGRRPRAAVACTCEGTSSGRPAAEPRRERQVTPNGSLGDVSLRRKPTREQQKVRTGSFVVRREPIDEEERLIRAP